MPEFVLKINDLAVIADSRVEEKKQFGSKKIAGILRFSLNSAIKIRSTEIHQSKRDLTVNLHFPADWQRVDSRLNLIAGQLGKSFTRPPTLNQLASLGLDITC